MCAYIIGAGSTRFGEHWELGIRNMISYASRKAIEHAGIKTENIDSAFVANCFGSLITGQSNVSAIAGDELGIQNTVQISGGDDAGSRAIMHAVNMVDSGKSKAAIVIGVEKTSDISSSQMLRMISHMTSSEEAASGATLASLYAMMTKKHMWLYGTTEEQMAMSSVKNHSNAMKNEISQFKISVTKEKVIASPIVADPLRVLNSAVASDGCSAVIICNEAMAKKSMEKIRIAGMGSGADYLAVASRENIAELNAVKTAVENALKSAGMKLRDIDFAEVHDVFSIAEIMCIEAMGFAKAGEGGKFIKEGHGNLDGKIPINPSGGLKGCGHPFAATGVRQAIEAFYQLTGNAGERQVKNAKCCIAQTLSGSGSSAAVNIFQRVD